MEFHIVVLMWCSVFRLIDIDAFLERFGIAHFN